MTEALTVEEAKSLIDLCRDGKLYDIEKWIDSGKSIQVPPLCKKTPLHVALDLGFHSLVELLVRNEQSQEVKNQALAQAVSTRRLELLQLLASHGAEIKSIPLADVLLTWEPSMIRFFLDNGADVVTGHPFAVAFREKIRTALRPFVEYKKTHPDLATELQEQADRALRHFSYEGDLKWVSLMMWAGASPRSRGPTLDDRYGDDPECYTTALEQAGHKGNLEVLKKLKPDPKQDDLPHLLNCAASSGADEVIKFLLSRGAQPNGKANGGSSALDSCLWHLHFENIDVFLKKRLASKYDVTKTMECIRELVEHGALWKPEDRAHLNAARQALFKCEPVITVELVKLFARHKACSEETLEQLLDAPRMRQHLSQLGMNLYRTPGKQSRLAR